MHWILGACSFLSFVPCLWALLHLCTAQRAIRHRLCWAQLVTLIIACLVHAAVEVVGTFTSWIFSDTAGWTMFVCVISEFLSCLMEVNIAAGFAAATFGSVRAAKFVHRSIPACIVISVLLANLVMRPWSKAASSWDAEHCRCSWMWWSVVTLSCCAVSLVIYTFAVVRLLRTAKGARDLWKQALFRMLLYSLSFLLTYSPLAIFIFMDSVWTNVGVFYLLDLNGFGAVCVYMYSVRRTQGLYEDASSVHADHLSHITAMEDLLIAQYFDFSGSFNAITDDARRSAALAVSSSRTFLGDSSHSFPARSSTSTFPILPPDGSAPCLPIRASSPTSPALLV